METARQVIIFCIAGLGLAGVALGRLPFLKLDRAGIALLAAVALVLAGGLTPSQALAAIDLDTIVLLLGMMVITVWLERSGLLALASSTLLRAARGPRSLLAVIILTSGVLSAFFINDTMCLVLTPLVAALCLAARRDPLPYLVGLATASNIGSMPSIVGNPQNMLIGSLSGISFPSFMFRLAPPALISLGIAWLVIVIAWGREFRGPARPLPAAPRADIDRGMAVKTLVACLGLLILLFLGMRPSLAAVSAAAFLLASRRVSAEEILDRIDFSLLLFFSCLFVITAAVRQTKLFQDFAAGLGARAVSDAWTLTGSTALLSNLVSNVPAVMLLSPLVEGSGDRPWLALALSSTFAGNLTLLGSVANLIVAESARKRGITLSFTQYLKAGIPITLISLVIGSLWLSVL